MINHATDLGRRLFNVWIRRYERYITAGALLGGFVFDSLTLTRIDFLYENVVIVGYLWLGAATIIVSALAVRGRLRGKLFERAGILAPFVLQFSFGGLFSAFLIFFARSASLLASWPFIAILAGLLIGNELFRARYQRFSFQILVWYIALYLYVVLVMPVAVGAIGPAVFVASGVLALGIVFLLIKALERVAPILADELRATPYRVMVLCFVGMNALYLLNIIPPFPLALKEADAYSFVARRANGEYIRERAVQPWYVGWFLRQRIEVEMGGYVYFYTSVFLPGDLATTIVHRWQRFDEEAREWVEVAAIPFSVRGGRDEGYRGFSRVRVAAFGLWRVRVETPRGQLLGRETFRVI